MAWACAVLLRPRAGGTVRRCPAGGLGRHVRWGVVPVEARIGAVAFGTSLFPRDGGYLLPVKSAVRGPLGLAPGDEVTVEMTVVLPG